MNLRSRWNNNFKRAAASYDMLIHQQVVPQLNCTKALKCIQNALKELNGQLQGRVICLMLAICLCMGEVVEQILVKAPQVLKSAFSYSFSCFIRIWTLRTRLSWSC